RRHAHALRLEGAREQHRGNVGRAAVPRRHEARSAHPGADAVQRRVARHGRLVRAALGGEPREASHPGRRGRRTDPTRRARRGRPNMTLTLDRVDPFHLGGLLMFLELATAYAGRLYGVNAFDQPGVELGKQFTYAMLGRSDADAARKEWDLLPKPDPKRII